MADKFINNIHYKIVGQGKPIIFIHGFSEDGTIWNDQIEFLKNDYLLIIPDLPGSGQSESLQKESCSLVDYADCIQEILLAENIANCTMIGHSMGGYITLAFAKKYPNLLNAFVLFHSSAYADNEEKIATRKKAIAFIKVNGAEAFLKTTIPGLFYDIEKSKTFIDELIKKANQFSATVLIQYYNAMINRPDTTEALRQFNGPIGVIMGEHDKAIPFQQSLQQSHIPKTSYVHILRHSGHMSMSEETEKVNDILATLLQNF